MIPIIKKSFRNIPIDTGTVLILESHALHPFQIALRPIRPFYRTVTLPDRTYTVAWNLTQQHDQSTIHSKFRLHTPGSGKTTLVIGDPCQIIAQEQYLEFIDCTKRSPRHDLRIRDPATKMVSTCKNAALIDTGGDGLFAIDLTFTPL
jgi:hypothetical protein